MIELERLNVVVLAQDEASANYYESMGYIRVIDTKNDILADNDEKQKKTSKRSRGNKDDGTGEVAGDSK